MGHKVFWDSNLIVKWYQHYRYRVWGFHCTRPRHTAILQASKGLIKNVLIPLSSRKKVDTQRQRGAMSSSDPSL